LGEDREGNLGRRGRRKGERVWEGMNEEEGRGGDDKDPNEQVVSA